ncbi:MAG: hypothetical protein KU38_05390 [Sulfurovum sp. FS08-3]|nr:MAG: hypothetical protein KU38_05390 [Sulfurovum sp. FS08-3]
MIDRFHLQKASFATLQQTQKIAFFKEGSTYVAINATYLQEKQSLGYRANSDDKSKGERFVVGIFLGDVNVTFEDMNITLNNQPPLEVTKLDSNDKHLLTIPMQNGWSHYYLVRFAYIEQKTINLTVTLEGEEKKNKKFYKVARYLLEPK